MKPTRFLILVIAIAQLSCSKTSYNALNQKDFIHISSTRKVKCFTIDTRSEEDYEKSHINNAVNIPFGASFFNDLKTYLVKHNSPKQTILFLYASTKEITTNQINEIKQESNLRKITPFKLISISYLNEDLNLNML